MKLEDEFKKVASIDNGLTLIEVSNKCVEIAENFAIGFSVWLDKNKKENKGLLIEELLEIYKKTL